MNGITRYIVWVLALLGFFTEAQISTSLDPSVRDVSELEIGFNRRSDPGSWWTNTSFMDLLSEMNPDIVRYPAGTQANYWDWSTGQFIPNTDKVWGNKEIVTIPTFVNALPNRAKVVYVANMARPTPATGVDVNASEAILKSDATMNMKIADMLNAIAEFEAQGKLPYAIELGNEFYFGNIESGIYEIIEDNGVFYSGWDATNNQPFQSANKKDATEITALFYLEHCKEVVSAIKAQYPNMKFVLTTTKGGNGDSARDRWNNTVFNNLENNPVFLMLKQDLYAVSQHHYLNENYGSQVAISDNQSAMEAIAEGIQYPIDKQSDYDLVPNDYKIWYTEYGEVKQIAEETWASGLRYATLVYSWLNRGDKVGQLGYHHITDENVFKESVPIQYAPIGIAAKLIATASAEMTEMQKIDFSTNPIAVNGVESLFGFKFKNSSKETLLIININDVSFDGIAIDNLLTYSGVRTLTQYNSTQPFVSGVFDGHQNITSMTSTVNSSFNVNPFSISVIEVENTLSVEEYELHSSIDIYPNPFQDDINLKSNSTLKSVEIFDLKGALVFSAKNVKDSVIKLHKLVSGIYMMRLENQNMVVFKKIIKK